MAEVAGASSATPTPNSDLQQKRRRVRKLHLPFLKYAASEMLREKLMTGISELLTL